MKAVVVTEFTTFDKAVIGVILDPVAGPGEVVVSLDAIETNFPDILYIEGKYQKTPPFPFSPGLSGAGRVSMLGEGVDAELMNQKVLVLPSYGAYAEKVLAPASFCFPIPDHMPATTAAAFGLVYQTAYFALTDRAQMKEGDTVLVLGATGGIGMAAVQLANALGAGKVIAATRGVDGGERARAYGADVVVDSAMDDLREGLRTEIIAATGGKGVDVVIDPVGGDLATAALRAMAWCGRFVVVGFASGDIPKFSGNYLLVKNIAVTGLQWTDYRERQLEEVAEAQTHIFKLWSEGKLVPQITETLPIEDFAKALSALSEGSASGKIILTTKSGDHQ